MRVSRRFRWWGLYALIPLMIGLLVLDDVVPMSETGHLVLVAAIALVICGLALAWIERDARFVEAGGRDGLGVYRVLRDTADGPSAQPLVWAAHQADEKTPAANRDTAVRSLAGQTMVEEARECP